MNKQQMYTIAVFLSSIILFAGCGQHGEDETYSGGYDNASLTTITQTEGFPDVSFPVNQLIVYAEETATHEDIVELLSNMRDVKLIGQAPAMGFYQITVRANDIDELDKAKNKLVANVLIKGAAYNILMSDRNDPGSCPAEPDVLMPLWSEHDRLPYYLTTYQTAIEIMQGLRDTLPLQEVTIGILENGYARSNGQFNDITIENYSESNSSGQRINLDDTSRHGTSVAGIICADNDGSGVCGLASTLIGIDRLRVIMAKDKTDDFMSLCTALESLIVDGGADIINNSFGLGPFDNETALTTLDTIEAFKEVMNRFQYVLFVNAAPNNAVELNGRNDAPAGIRLPNTLTVSTWTHDDASVRYSDAAYGDVVDISAAGRDLLVLMPSGTTMERSGTSFAAPMVTAAAALLKSIAPDLSPLEIKSMMLDPTFHGELTEPGGGIQLSFAAPLVDLLWEKYQNTSWGTLLLDADEDGLHDSPEIIETHICEQAALTIDGFGSFSIVNDHACSSGTAMLMDSDGSSWSMFLSSLFNESNDRLSLTFSNENPTAFSLEDSYSFSSETLSMGIQSDNLIDDSDCTSEDPVDGDFHYQGFSNTGSCRFTRCSVSERNSDGKAKYLSVDIHYEGSVDGYLRTYYPSSTPSMTIDEYSTSFSGFVKGVRVSTLDVFGTYTQAVENACLGKSEEEEE